MNNTTDDDDRSFLLIPIVLETLTYRCCHNRRIVGGKMVSGPPHVMCHIGDGGDFLHIKEFLQMVEELAKYGYSYSVTGVTVEKPMLEVIGFSDDKVWHQEEKYPDFDVKSW